MKIKIKYGGPLSEILRKREEEYESDYAPLSVAQLITDLFNRYADMAKFFEGDPTKVFEHSMVFVNSRVVSPNEILNIQINEGDLVAFLPVVTGG
ncbi:MAG: MoaD/ThiS family protein [Candidatus Bathyarchaeia archaeon]